MFGGKEKPLTREDAKELYNGLQKSLDVMKARKRGGAAAPVSPRNGAVSDATAKAIAAEISAAMKKDISQGKMRPASSTILSKGIETLDEAEVGMQYNQKIRPSISSPIMSDSGKNKGSLAAVSLIAAFAVVKIGFAFLDYTGVFNVPSAEATMQVKAPPFQNQQPEGNFTQQEFRILTALDARRVELESKSQQLDERQKDLDNRDREFASRMTELRELSSKLKIDREKTEKKQDAQLVQLANVYNSMNPAEAAQLLDQLDETTTIALLEKMSEKRIGQILPVMKPERALAMTRMLSGRR